MEPAPTRPLLDENDSEADDYGYRRSLVKDDKPKNINDVDSDNKPSSKDIVDQIIIKESNTISIDSVVDFGAPCAHYNLTLYIDISIWQTILCYLCCCLGFVSLIAAATLKACDGDMGCCVDASATSGYVASEAIFWNTHWLCYYGYYDMEFVQKRMSSNRRVREVDSGFCGMKHPHYYEIICSNCLHVLKRGYKFGGLVCGIIFGLIGGTVFVTALILILTL
jgi:hypothetical protein